MKFNLIFASDDRGVDMMATAIYSVIKNNQNHKLNFYIIHSSISSDNIKRIKKLEHKFPKNTITFVAADNERFDGIGVNNPNVTMEAYYRYLAPEILPKEDRALCMDFDMLCLDDVSELYNTDLGDNYIGAVAEYFVTDDNPDNNYLYRQIRREIGFKKTDIYINSGLMLFNLKLLRESNIMDKFWENIRNKGILLPGRTNHFADQTITNLTFKDKVKYLDRKYNVYTTALEELNIKEPAIIHFTGHNKPLTYSSELSSIYDDVYLQYYNECVHIIGYGKNHLIKNTVQKIRKDINYRQHQVDTLLEKNDELRFTIGDREQELAVLHRQQRDVRFLAKRLVLELQTRLNRRAQGLIVGNHLYYKKSNQITMLNNSPRIAKHDLGKIHKLDVENISNKNVTIIDRLKPLGWKIIAKVFNFSLRVGKKVYHHDK